MRLAGYVAATSVALVLGAAAASAQNGPWYLKGFGGFTFPQSDATTVTAPVGTAGGTIDYDTGYALGAAVGYSLTPNISAELEYAYRSYGSSLDDETGYEGLPTHDPDALASGLHSLWADPAARERLGRAAYDGVRAHYTIAHSADRLTGVYESLTSAASPRASKGAVLRDSA